MSGFKINPRRGKQTQSFQIIPTDDLTCDEHYFADTEETVPGSIGLYERAKHRGMTFNEYLKSLELKKELENNRARHRECCFPIRHFYFENQPQSEFPLPNLTPQQSSLLFDVSNQQNFF